MSRLEVIAHLKVRPGQLDGFKRQAAELVRLANEQDTGTLRYDWFLSRDGSECEVHEAYESSESMMEHAAHIAEARNTMFAEYAEDHVVKVFGEPSPQFFAMVEGMQKAGHVTVTWFSFLQGLESPARV
jgi:quinol monooxygenase YgiN